MMWTLGAVVTLKNYQKWKNHVLEKSMKGIQIHSGHDSEFVKFYDIGSLPRFIFLDKNLEFALKYLIWEFWIRLCPILEYLIFLKAYQIFPSNYTQKDIKNMILVQISNLYMDIKKIL